MIDNSQQAVSELIGLSDDELAVLWRMNDEVPPRIGICANELVSQQARSNPTKLAVHSWDGDLSYTQVDGLSTQLAYQLQIWGVGLHKVVPLCFEKSKWTVVAMLAVMKSGGAFALLDPSQPEQRLSTIVSDVQATLVLSSQSKSMLAERLIPSGLAMPVSEGLFDSIPPAPLERLKLVPSSAEMYIQFTSGSTGHPKGIPLSHANFTSGAMARAKAVGYRDTSRVLDFPSYAFDVAIDCMLCTLMRGGTICVPSEAQRLNDLAGAILGLEANMAHMTPSVARVLDSEIMARLDVLGLGGEAVSARDAREWSKLTRVVVAYGPSECTVGCTINEEVDGRKEWIGIGRGVGCVTWIVDPEDHTRLMPPFAVGELLVEGHIVGPGYLNNKEKTAEVFIEDPPWLEHGYPRGFVPGRPGRLYKTGDLVKYAPDASGELIFVGRKDSQVKLRGQRVELGEVEHHVRHWLPSGTRLSAEVIRPNQGKGQPMLVVFIEQESTTPGADEQWSSFLRDGLQGMDERLSQVLPVYMMPSAYVPVAVLPMMVSGKTNRKELQRIGSDLTVKDLAEFQAMLEKPDSGPRVDASDPQSNELLSICAHLLNREESKVGLNDNFFFLGGDSILAMKLVAMARKSGWELSVSDVFSGRTLADIAKSMQPNSARDTFEVPRFTLIGKEVQAEHVVNEVSNLLGLDPVQIEDVYPCTPLQEGLMALSAKFSDAYVAQRVLELPSAPELDDLQKALTLVYEDCPILRTRIVQTAGNGLLQVVLKTNMRWAKSSSLQKHIQTDQRNEMGLCTELCRFASIQDEVQGRIYFVWTMHHALYDGWSIPLMLQRLRSALYGQSTERPAEFKHFIRYLSESDQQASKSFWADELWGVKDTQYPAHPKTDYITKADSLLERYVSVNMARGSGTTLATIIRGAWAIVAATYSGCDDVVFGETLTGRSAPVKGIEEIEGPMITTIPVRVNVDVSKTVSEFLSELRGKDVARIPHEHFGLQNIRRVHEDARIACDLRTGLVIQPKTEDPPVTGDLVSGLAPANDVEAAREALKFNTYGLMLVCSVESNGFLIMASFDSNVLDLAEAERTLALLSHVVQQLCEDNSKLLSQLSLLSPEDANELRIWNKQAPVSVNPRTGRLEAEVGMGLSYPPISVPWVVSPSDDGRLQPIGAPGRLLIEGPLGHQESIPVPGWLQEQRGQTNRPARLSRTNDLVRYGRDGKMLYVGMADGADNESSPPATPSEEVSVLSPWNMKTPQPTTASILSDRQKHLRELWSDVLGMKGDDIGLDDSFFNLGADSITAMKLVFIARREGFDLTVTDIFRYKTLRSMTEALKSATAQLETTAYAPFSAVAADDVEYFRQQIQSQLAEPTWNIKDVLPTTALQAGGVDATIQEPRFSLQYCLLYLDESVDADRLSRCFKELVDEHEILRTVFIDYQGDCLQVVLESVEVEYTEFAVDGDLEAEVTRVCSEDCAKPLRHGEVWLKTFTVRGPSGAKCFVVKISHAQYDGMCLSKLLLQLGHLYNGDQLAPHNQFSAFMYHVLEVAPKGYPFWKQMLQDSSISVVAPPAVEKSPRAIAISKEIDISNRTRDFTLSTTTTAAWAVVVARHLGIRDVVFGQVVAARNIGIPDCDTIMGKCDHHAPVRVKFVDSWLGKDLLEHVQEQLVSKAPWEATSFKDIIRNCTSWPESTQFDSVVHHHDIDYFDSMEVGGTTCRLDTVNPHSEPAQEWKIQSWSQGNKLTVEIICSESWKPLGYNLLTSLEETVRQLIFKAGENIFEIAN
jgi:fusarinine C synthase